MQQASAILLYYRGGIITGEYNVLVTISDNNDTNYKHDVIVKVNESDYFTLKNYESEDYDNAWDRLCEQIEDTGEPDDWFIDGIEFRGQNKEK